MIYKKEDSWSYSRVRGSLQALLNAKASAVHHGVLVEVDAISIHIY